MTDFVVVPATRDRFADFAALMGPGGGSGGCWCMLWRMTNKQFNAASREARKDAIRQAFEADRPPGLLAYDAERAVGWCSLAPRAAFPRLETSRILQPVDTEPVWSVSCFFIHRDYRGKGLSVAMLEAGARFVAEQGGQILEGYPVDAGSRKYPGSFAWVGLASAYERAGFTEVARRSPTRRSCGELSGPLDLRWPV